MKAILTILLFWFLNANATTYYVSPSTGNDANAGTSVGSPWQTMSKLNSFAFQDYAVILVKGGDSLFGSFNNFTKGMYFGSYGVGNAYVIGTKKATLIQKGATNVWVANLTDASANLKLVVIDDTPRAKARYPNNSYLRFNDTTSTSTVLQTSETGAPSRIGLEIVVRDAMFIIDNRIVSGQSAGALTLNSALTYTPNIGGDGYFFQNDSTLLDSKYEWCCYSNGRFMVYLTAPTDVWYATVDTLFRIKHKDDVFIQHINLHGSNKIGVQIDTSNGSKLSDFSINNIGENGISAQKCDTLDITQGSIKNCFNLGALLRSFSGSQRADLVQYLNWDYDTMQNIGLYPGMGLSNNGTYMGMYLVGFYNKVQHSIFKNIGFNAMYVVGRFDSIRYNYFDSFCVTKDDGAAIYTWLDGAGAFNDGGAVWAHDWDSGMYWHHNIAVHGIGNQSGCNPNSIYYGAGASGFYTDLNANNIKIEYNTGAYGRGNMLSIGVGAHNDTIRYNTFYNNQDRVRDLLGNNTTTYSMLINKNIYYLGDSTYTEIFDAYKGGTAAGISQDSNYYTGVGVNNLYTTQNQSYSFSGYVTATGYDTHGGTNPTARNRTAILIYNPTLADSTISLPDTYTDVYGTLYFTSVTLHAFDSRILFPYTHQFSKTDHFLIPH